MRSSIRKRSPAVKNPTTLGLRVGGRSERVVADVLSAAARELAARGYAGFRIERVASAAGVNKTTIYRRWPTKADLVEAALREIAPHSRDRPRTGSVAGDLFELLRRLVHWQKTAQGASIVRMVHLEAQEPALVRIVRRLREESMDPWIAAIEQAKARGEIGIDVDARLLAELILVPTMVRLHRLGERVDDPTLAEIVRIVVGGARPEVDRHLRAPATPRSIARKRPFRSDPSLTRTNSRQSAAASGRLK